MIDLERALTDLAGHLDYPGRLDYPAGDRAAEDLRRRLTGTPTRRARMLLAAAAVLTVVALGVVVIAPARHAVADWLGIGAVEVRRSGTPPPTGAAPGNTVPGAPGSKRVADAAKRLAAARKAVQFTIATPSLASAGALAGVEVDRRVPGGLVALTYARFTVVEIATDPTQAPPLAKSVGGARALQHVTVNGQPGVWVASIHEIGYVDRRGGFRFDTVRRAGPVLLWQGGGVTYRIEGLGSLDAAQTAAASMR